MKIGITYTGTSHKHDNYTNWIKGNDAIEIVKLTEDDNNLQDVSLCDAIILSGGIDIDPEIYKGNSTYPFAPKSFKRDRDIFEIAIFEKTQQIQLPVLGVCRGMQLINCYYGGTLLQDLGEKNTTHKITDVADKMHGIHITEHNSIIYQTIQNDMAAVNSAHHQAIDKLGEGLKVTAISEDGIPEVLERVNIMNAPFLLCVQWHPERMYKFGLQETRAAKALRTTFLEAIKNR